MERGRRGDLSLTEGTDAGRDGMGGGFFDGVEGAPEGGWRGEGVERRGEVEEFVVRDFELAASDGPSLVEDDAVDVGCVLEGLACIDTASARSRAKSERATYLRHTERSPIAPQSPSRP